MFAFFVFVLATVGVLIAYRFSPAAKLRPELQNALSPFEELDTEIRSLLESLNNETDSLATQHLDSIYAARLQAIPIDELKKYATGMRLQALKDFGVQTVADLQGWNEYRVAQVRGIGPKSAIAIVNSVATATAATRAIPIPRPHPPFSTDSERQLMQALYRQRWFISHVSEPSTVMATAVTSHQCTRDAILAKTKFSQWLWKFGKNDTIRRSLEQGNALIEALADHDILEIKESLSQTLAECRRICANRVPVESIIQDFSEMLSFYDAYLTTKFGPAPYQTPEKSIRPAESGKSPKAELDLTQLERIAPGTPSRSSTASLLGPDLQTAKPQLAEKLFSISVRTTTSGPSAPEFTLPSPPRLEPSDLRWLKEGEAIQIQGYNISHGFIYVGKGANDQQYFAIDPHLSAKPGEVIPDSTGYYSNYSVLSSQQRSQYLTWLAEGALSSSDSSFGTVYFYGIERRVLDLLQGRVSDPHSGELEVLLKEVHRLANLFQGRPGGVTECCMRLLDFADSCTLDVTSIPELPKEWVKTWELPIVIRYGIGWFAKEKKPIPVDWALRWAYTEPTIYLRTPATRCPQEFEAAFSHVYRKKFGDGLVVPANKTKLKISYRPGWPVHYGAEIRHDFSGIPDIAAVTTPQQTIKALVEDATAEIDGYSRYVGRNPAKVGTLEAYLNIHVSLWAKSATERWRELEATRVESLQPMTFESLLRVLDSSGEPSATKVAEIVANLARNLVGFEPDILAGARRPKPSEVIVLFPLTSATTPERDKPEYKRASLIVSLAACVALADGVASSDEAAAVEGMIASWNHLHIDLRMRLRAHYRLQVRNGISFANLKSRFASLTPDGRLQMAVSLSALAAADGSIAAAEVKLLEQIYRALELEPSLLYSHLHAGKQQACELAAPASCGVSGPTAYVVDTARLETLRRETDQVSALLADVFAEEELTSLPKNGTADQASPSAATSDDTLLPGLDVKHQQFLTALLSKSSWTRKELQDVAAHLQIMLDGALERVNEAAFDLAGEPVTEGDDPICVQQSILEAAE